MLFAGGFRYIEGCLGSVSLARSNCILYSRGRRVALATLSLVVGVNHVGQYAAKSCTYALHHGFSSFHLLSISPCCPTVKHLPPACPDVGCRVVQRLPVLPPRLKPSLDMGCWPLMQCDSPVKTPHFIDTPFVISICILAYTFASS